MTAGHSECSKITVQVLHSFAALVLRNSIPTQRIYRPKRVIEKYRVTLRNHRVLRTLTGTEVESIVSRALEESSLELLVSVFL